MCALDIAQDARGLRRQGAGQLIQARADRPRGGERVICRPLCFRLPARLRRSELLSPPVQHPVGPSEATPRLGYVPWRAPRLRRAGLPPCWRPPGRVRAPRVGGILASARRQSLGLLACAGQHRLRLCTHRFLRLCRVGSYGIRFLHRLAARSSRWASALSRASASSSCARAFAPFTTRSASAAASPPILPASAAVCSPTRSASAAASLTALEASAPTCSALAATRSASAAASSRILAASVAASVRTLSASSAASATCVAATARTRSASLAALVSRSRARFSSASAARPSVPYVPRPYRGWLEHPHVSGSGCAPFPPRSVARAPRPPSVIDRAPRCRPTLHAARARLRRAPVRPLPWRR